MSKKVKVNVNTDEIAMGEDMILTLQDQQLLVGQELNDEFDVLENLAIQEKDKLEFKRQQEEKIKINKRTYADKFEDENGQKQLLSHYDELKMEKTGFFIDEQYQQIEDDSKKIDSIISRLKKPKSNEFNLFFEDKVASDYKPTQLQGKFQKRIVKPNQIKSGSRNIINDFDQTPLRVNSSMVVDDEEDEELQLRRSIDMKMKEQLKSNLKQGLSKQEEKLKLILDENQNCEKQQIMKQQQEFTKPAAKKTKEGVQELTSLSSTTDFLNSVKTDVEIQENNLRISAPTPFSVKDSREGTASILNVSLPTERLLGYTRRQNNQDIQRLEQESYLAEEDIVEIDKLKHNIEFMEDEQLGVGLSCTLKTMRDRGFLNEDIQDYVGRSKDKVIPSSEKEIQLEYRDPQGRLMTPKEAFRYQCWIFHGKGPGKNKQEKRIKKEMMREKIRSQQPEQTPLMQALQVEQSKSNQSYMILSSKKQFD